MPAPSRGVLKYPARRWDRVPQHSLTAHCNCPAKRVTARRRQSPKHHLIEYPLPPPPRSPLSSASCTLTSFSAELSGSCRLSKIGQHAHFSHRLLIVLAQSEQSRHTTTCSNMLKIWSMVRSATYSWSSRQLLTHVPRSKPSRRPTQMPRGRRRKK